MSCSKRNGNRKRRARESKRRVAEQKRRTDAQDRARGDLRLPSARTRLPLRGPPSELDQMAVFITEQDLRRTPTTLAGLRSLARQLPFEPAMHNVAVLNARLDPVLNSPSRQWDLAQSFYGSDQALLSDLAAAHATAPNALMFSPQPLIVLVRVLIDDAVDEPQRDLTADEFATLQKAVLGSHSALESSLDAKSWPEASHVLAFELQASALFHREKPLEVMARHDELLRLAADDERLLESKNRVPVEEWLAAAGLTAEQQWTIGFGLSAMTRAFADDIKPRVTAEHLDDLLFKLHLPDVSRELPALASDRQQLRAAFAAFGGDTRSMAWELRPFKATPFLRMANGDMELLAPTWLLSWLGEGFHYRALTQAQRTEPPAVREKYTRYTGEVVERYALDLAETAFPAPVTVLGEQPYGKGDGKSTSDVAVASGEDLVLFEVHARRVMASAAVTGDAVAATTEITKLIVGKADQLGVCIRALLDEDAHLPGVDIACTKRIWPIVVSMGHVMQTRTLWDVVRAGLDPTKTASFADERVQPLQILTIADYEKLLGLVTAGSDLPTMLAQRARGPYRERDFAVWLKSDRAAPNDRPRHPELETRWECMGDRALKATDLSIGLRPADDTTS
jgi:hypothetical protein